MSLIAALAWCCTAGVAAADDATPVQTALVAGLAWQNSVELVANIAARQQASLAAQRAGQVVGLNYTSGDIVAAGTVLVRLNDAPERAQLALDEAKQTQTHDALARAVKLMTINGASKAALEQAQADAAEAAAQVSADEAVLAQLTVVAPFTGTLGIRSIAIGDYITQGQIVAQLTQAAPLRVLFVIPQNEAAAAVGDKFSVVSPQAATGHITALSPVVDAATNARAAEGGLDSGGANFVPGSLATILLQTGAAIPAFKLPATALNDSLLGQFVFVVAPKNNADILRIVYVTQLAREGDDAVISATGLKAGDRVVAIGGFKLSDGETVKITP